MSRRLTHRALSCLVPLLSLVVLAGCFGATPEPLSTSKSTSGLVMRIEQGVLEDGDAVLTSGELSDELTIHGEAGHYLLLDLTAEGFDPYLILIAPNGEQFENDDYEGDASRSLLGLELPQSGEYQVLVTSYAAEEKGAWTLAIGRPSDEAAAAGSWVEEGELADGDDTLTSGELKDDYFFEGLPGQSVRLDLSSDELDTYLILIDPKGLQLENDDAPELPGHSVIEADLEEAGSYHVVVTSYEPQVGAYRLAVAFGGSRSTVEQRRDVVALDLGSTLQGSLAESDPRAEDGSFTDLYVFQGEAGQAVAIEMRSGEVDTYLELWLPDGSFIANDDGPAGVGAPSLIELQLPVSGRYRLVATSLYGGERGDYELSLAPMDPALLAAYPSSRDLGAPAGRVFALLVGISDYGGRMNDLPYTADDAFRLRDALIDGAGLDPADAVLLTDREATVGAVRAAVRDIGARMSADDLFVFFYSGHGNRLPRLDPQPADPDGLDESLSLYDDELSDDDMAVLLSSIHTGRTLLLLDSCFSGGFAKDVISVPGRMGLFSSEEDVTSQVAEKFRAGGFLAYFLADALTDGYADDGDGQLTTLELSQYVYERYRGDVKSSSEDDVVMVGPQLGFQHLVIDRGSLSPFETLFWLR